jgi:hypothetical protein
VFFLSLIYVMAQLKYLFAHIKIDRILCRDNIPTVILFEWDLEADYIDEAYLSGILPVLFAEDPAAAEAGIKDNQTFAMKDVDRLNRMFFIPEGLGLEEAHRIVKKARLGDVNYVFKDKNLERIFNAVPLHSNQGKFNHTNL